MKNKNRLFVKHLMVSRVNMCFKKKENGGYNAAGEEEEGGGFDSGGDDEGSEEEKKKMKSLLKAVSEQTSAQLKAFRTEMEKKGFTKEEVEGRIEKIEKKSVDIKNLKEYTDMVGELNQVKLDMKAFKEASVGAERGIKKGSIAELLAKSKSKIDGFISNKSGTLELEYKTGGATETSTDIANRDAYFTWHEGGSVGRLPVRRPFMRELIKNVTTATEYIKYIDQATIVRDAQNAALCAAITTTTKETFAVNTLQILKVKDMINICLDMMNDYSFVQGETQNLLNSSMALKIDNDLVLGTGISPILNGIVKYASTFSANGGGFSGADYTGAVPNAQLIDLISVCGAQIRAFGYENMYAPDTVLLNPRDLQALKYLKDNMNNYIKNSQLFSTMFQDRNGRYYIDGMLLVPNPLIPQNELYIFDSQKATLYSKPGIGIEFAYENGTNFETDTVTLKVYERLNMLVRNVDANAFMHVADIAAAIDAINGGAL